MRKRYWKFKHFKYINGIRGAISLFLAVIMTPFLTIAMALVETGRYNSAVSVLDEAMGISSTATLANYDEYLHKRWGLLAADQGSIWTPCMAVISQQMPEFLGQA